ncbi:MAG: hypothetical protein AVDCRST_MAG19-731, partial [uncultured Thermomicrobiales bacterium]
AEGFSAFSAWWAPGWRRCQRGQDPHRRRRFGRDRCGGRRRNRPKRGV